MSKLKKKSKKKIRLFLIFLLVIALGAILYLCSDKSIKNIFIHNNNIFTDQEIIDMAGLTNYPNFFTTTGYNVKKKLLKNDYIKGIKVRKSIFMAFHIYVDEYSVLFERQSNGKVVLENGKEIDNTKNVVVPFFINDSEIEEERLDEFIKKYSLLSKDVTVKISEIKYDPTDLDKDRFLFYMNDQNYVYITLTKIDTINKYNEMIEKFEGKKGILYLDSGNYFQIK